MITKAPALTAAPQTRKFTVAEYHQMDAAGVFHPEERVELIAGVIMLKSPPAPVPANRKFTVTEYYRLADAGILRPEERVELVAGEIVVMSPIGSRHGSLVARLVELILGMAAGTLIVWPQNSIHLDEHSELQPDIALLRPRPDFYAAANPGPVDTLLTIEVSDTTLNYDRNVKIPRYAAANIPETWQVNLPDDCIARFSQPGPDGYRQHSIARRGERIAPLMRPDLEFAVADLLPLADNT